MSQVPLDLDDLYSGDIPDAIVKLTCPGYTATEFISPIVNDFALSGSASMVQPFSEYASDLQASTQKLTAAAQIAAHGFNLGSIDFSKFAVYKTRAQTIRMYQDSSFAGINLDMVFIVTSRSNISRYHDAIELSSCVYPDPNAGDGTQATSGQSTLSYYQMDASVLKQMLRPPCGYRIGDNGMPQNTWSIQIGTYFRASGFILESAALNQTKERLEKGIALISTVSCQFSPALDITSDQYRSWFIN
ncbi:hypothetical protein [Salmonella enterica]|uniref:hypothetical protein n=1 Tax=Salmonella enterica TaxID=28901 RepID=UPI0004F1D1AC|nr:hypothetical protein [Salmonella enterica]ECO4189837.1 hypothetical protein [Salmonella enterica]EDQ9893543.1 hypothetical protein [Salmonella enterica subsp. enterica]